MICKQLEILLVSFLAVQGQAVRDSACFISCCPGFSSLPVQALQFGPCHAAVVMSSFLYVETVSDVESGAIDTGPSHAAVVMSSVSDVETVTDVETLSDVERLVQLVLVHMLDI